MITMNKLREFVTNNIHIILIVLVASVFRFTNLTKTPPGLNWDEVSIGYNAYSILKTGRDEWGHRLPIMFKAYGEYKLPAMIYVSIPAIAIFGLNDFGVRVTPAFIGVLTVLATYFLIKEIYNKKIATYSALLLSISPWHTHLSRASFEAILGLFFMVLGMLFLIKQSTMIRNKTKVKPSRYIINIFLSIISLTLSMYSYNSSRIVIPLMLSVLFITQKTMRRKIVYILISVLILSAPLINSLRSPESMVRWKVLNFANNKSFISKIGESRSYTKLPSPLPRLIHNKYTHYIYQFFINYTKSFSTEFLIFNGSAYTQRSTQGMGLLYFFELPLLVLGLYEFYKSNNKYKQYITSWLLISPIPSAITIDAPSSLRSLYMIIPLMVVESFGLKRFLSYIKNKSVFLRITTLLFVLWNISLFSYRLFMVYPIKYSSDWQYGYKDAVLKSMEYYNTVDKIYFTTKYGEPYMYFLFYTKYDPTKFQQEKVERSIDGSGWVHVVSFDKFYFTDFAGLQSPNIILQNNKNKRFLFVGGFAEIQDNKYIKNEFEIVAPNMVTMFSAKIGYMEE